MTPDDRLKLAIGDLFLRAVFGEAKLEQAIAQNLELEGQLKQARELTKAPPVDDGA
jgi:hypothetical protein